jgi:DNA-directed RNA polymerase subunit RPC12/RpoP
MQYVITCNSCKQQLRVADQSIGKTIQCPRCSVRFVVPAPASSSAPQKSAAPPAPPPKSSVDLPEGELLPNEPVTLELADQEPNPFRRGGGRPTQPTAKPVSMRFMYLTVGLITLAGLAVFGAWGFYIYQQIDSNVIANIPPPSGRPNPWNPGPKPPWNQNPPAPPNPNPIPFPNPDPPPEKPADPPWEPPVQEVRLTIQPPNFAGDSYNFPFPNGIQDVAVGGGGRYLVLKQPKSTLVIFDVNRFKPNSIFVGEEEFKVAAGIDKCFVALPKSRRLIRYDLATGIQEANVLLPEAASGLCMGSASHGPLMVCQTPPGAWGEGGTFTWYDPATLKPVSIELDGQRPTVAVSTLRASANGQVFVMRPAVGGEPHEVCSIVLTGARGKVFKEWISSSVLIPSSDGQTLYGESGVYTNALKVVFPQNETEMFKPFWPAHGSNLFLEIKAFDRRFPPEMPGDAVLVYKPGEEMPFETLKNIEGASGDIGKGGALGREKRLHLIPDAKILICIPFTDNKLIIRRFNMNAKLEKD